MTDQITTTEPFPALTEAKMQQPTELRFVYCEHTSENVPAIVEAIGDADVVALEFITYEDVHEGLERIANEATLRDPKTDLSGLSIQHDVLYDIVDRLRGSGKQIYFIDVSKEKIEELSESVDSKMEKLFQDNLFTLPLEEVKIQLAARMGEYAQINTTREREVKRQIEVLIQKEPGKKIAIMQGAMHSATSHIQRKGIKTERVFVPSSDEQVKYRFDNFSPVSAIERHLAFFPDKPPSSQMVNLTTLELYLLNTLDIGLSDLDITIEEAEEVLAEVDQIIERNKNESASVKFILVKDRLKTLPRKDQ